MRTYKIIILNLLLLFLSTNAHSNENVKIFTWWGYLKHPDILNTIKAQCKTEIEYSEYVSNREFLRRADEDDYDILIYMDTGLNRKVVAKKPSLYNISKTKEGYHPRIKKQFELESHRINTAYLCFGYYRYIVE